MRQHLLAILIMAALTASKAQWSNDHTLNLKLTNLPGEQVIPKIARCQNGNFYVGYFSLESGNYNVRLQYLSNLGHLLWPENGIIVSTHPSMSWLTDWDMTVDHAGHAVLVWQDIRTGNNQIVAYRIGPEGQFTWGQDGILLSNNNGFNTSPKVVALPDGDVVFAWQSDNVIYRQRLNASGQKKWGENGIVLSGSGTYSWPQLIVSGQSEVFMKYFIDTGPVWAPTRKIYVRKFNMQGNDAWSNPTEVYNLGAITAWTQLLPITPDGDGGFYMTWHDYSFNVNAATPRINHILGNGQLQWGSNGLHLSELHSSNQLYPMVARNAGDPHVYTFWLEQDMNQTLWGIFAQKTAPDGTNLWGFSGKEIIPVTTQIVYPIKVETEANDIVLFYKYANGPTQTSLRAIRLNNQGEMVWPQEALISSTISDKDKIVLTPFADGQWVLAWEDHRNGNADIFAQNMQSDGSLGPVPPTRTTQSPTKNGSQLFVAPNPVNQNSLIHLLALDNTQVHIQIFDACGKTIIQKNLLIQKDAIPRLYDLLEGKKLKAGMYMINITQGSKNYSGRFVAQLEL